MILASGDMYNIVSFYLLVCASGVRLHGQRDGTRNSSDLALISELMDKVEILEKRLEATETEIDTLEDKVIPWKIAATCEEWSRRGNTTDGRYLIKPSLHFDAFEVQCNFTGSSAKTIISHDRDAVYETSTPLEAGGCDPAGCYNDTITYEVSIDDIAAVIALSSSCEQAVTHHCSHSALTDFAWWTDRNGAVQKYWDGDHVTGTEGCQCSLGGGNCTSNSARQTVRGEIFIF